MANLAIKGHPTKGNEVIKILEMLGGVNFNNHDGCRNMLYFISTNECEIMADFIANNPSYNIYTLETFLEQFPYKTGDSVIVEGKECFITDLIWHNELNCIRYNVFHTTGSLTNGWYYVCNLQPYETMEEKNNDNWEKWELPDGYEFQDTDGNIINTSVIRLVKKQPQYPKTYEECCEVLGYEPDRQTVTGYDAELIENLQTLKLCRDAYWKIVGDWKPDWTKANERKSCIVNTEGNITKWVQKTTNKILAFPSEEMRDAFYENFKELIEECKELL